VARRVWHRSNERRCRRSELFGRERSRRRGALLVLTVVSGRRAKGGMESVSTLKEAGPSQFNVCGRSRRRETRRSREAMAFATGAASRSHLFSCETMRTRAKRRQRGRYGKDSAGGASRFDPATNGCSAGTSQQYQSLLVSHCTTADLVADTIRHARGGSYRFRLIDGE